MATYTTTYDGMFRIKRMDDACKLVPAAQIGLHPEADARLAAATGGGAIDADAILRHHEENQVHRIEARVEHGPSFALVGTIAEIDARLRSGFVGVDVATGETGKANEWPMVAKRMREEWAQVMARGVPTQGHIKSIAVVRGNGTGAHLLDGTAIHPGDTVTAERDNEGKWTARVTPATPAKPAALAAGQVWAVGDARYEITGHRVGGRWAALSEGANYLLHEADLLRCAECRYLGTREEIAAMSLDFTGAAPRLTDRDESIKAIRDALASSWFGCDHTMGETDGALRVRCRASVVPFPGPQPASPLAALRAEIDRLIAAEERRGAPFIQAKRAALATLVPDHCAAQDLPSDALVRASITALDAYENARPGHRKLTQVEYMRAFSEGEAAWHEASGGAWSGTFRRADFFARYERERSRCAVHGRRRP